VFAFLLLLLARSFLPSLVRACLRIFRGCACSLLVYLVDFSCLVVRSWLLLVLFLLVGLSCPLRCLSFSSFSWCAWWHRFHLWSSCLVFLGLSRLGSFCLVWSFFPLSSSLVPFLFFGVLALSSAAFFPCSSWLFLGLSSFGMLWLA